MLEVRNTTLSSSILFHNLQKIKTFRLEVAEVLKNDWVKIWQNALKKGNYSDRELHIIYKILTHQVSMNCASLICMA